MTGFHSVIDRPDPVRRVAPPTAIIAATIKKNLPQIAHIQLADNPGRNEPGTGEINYPFLFDLLDSLGYEGYVGCEYKPRTTTAAGLATFDENDTTCCYARQDKVWVHDPAGAPWEVYVVTDDDPADASPPASQIPLAPSGQSACCTQAAQR